MCDPGTNDVPSASDAKCDDKKDQLKTTPKKRQREDDKTPVGQLAKRPKTGETGSSRTMITGQPREPSIQSLLVLPPIPMDIYEGLTSMFDGLDSNDSATEPETDTDEAERRKIAFKKK